MQWHWHHGTMDLQWFAGSQAADWKHDHARVVCLWLFTEPLPTSLHQLTLKPVRPRNRPLGGYRLVPAYRPRPLSFWKDANQPPVLNPLLSTGWLLSSPALVGLEVLAHAEGSIAIFEALRLIALVISLGICENGVKHCPFLYR